MLEVTIVLLNNKTSNVMIYIVKLYKNYVIYPVI